MQGSQKKKFVLFQMQYVQLPWVVGGLGLLPVVVAAPMMRPDAWLLEEKSCPLQKLFLQQPAAILDMDTGTKLSCITFVDWKFTPGSLFPVDRFQIRIRIIAGMFGFYLLYLTNRSKFTGFLYNLAAITLKAVSFFQPKLTFCFIYISNSTWSSLNTNNNYLGR
jgi:hypothetical protein